MRELVMYSLFKLPIASPRVNCPRYRLDRYAGLCTRCEYFRGMRDGFVVRCNHEIFDEDEGMNLEAVMKLKELEMKL